MKDHFDKTYFYIIGNTGIILLYIAAVTFFPVPKENQRFVDIALGILLGILNSNAAYLTGGSPNQQKKSSEPGTPGTITVPEQEIETQKPKEETP